MNYLRQLNLFGKIADIPYDLIGETDPTSATEARSGMGYFNKLSRAFFICVDDTPGAYIWIKVAGGGNSSENTGGGEPGVGITSITPVSTSDESNGVNIYAINLTDGSSYNIEVRNGSAGRDYVLTEADKAEIAGMVDVPTISDVEVVQMWSDNPENDTYAIRITCDDGSEYTAELPALITDPSRVVILHDGTPTDSTEGAKHQLLVDTATLNIYVCLGSSGIGAMTYYTWQQIQGAVTSVNGKTGAVKLSASDVGALPNTTKIPAKTSEIQNDSGFVTNTVSNLTNYYLKTETYTREEVTALIAAIKTYTVSVVSELPSTGAEKVIYLVVKKDGSDGDAHSEYLWVNGKFEFIGTTAVDLTGYAKEDWVTDQLANYLLADELQSAVENALTRAKNSGEFDGVSPVVSVSSITGGQRITIIDRNGSTYVDVFDGVDGDPGKPGTPGSPGRGIVSVVRTSGDGSAGTMDTYTITYTDDTTSTFSVYNGANGDPGASPTVSITDITGGHRITITDKEGVKTVDVMDGSDGDPGDPGRGISSIARTSGNGAAGTTDTYTIMYTDNTTGTFSVYNGADGSPGTSPTVAVSDITGGHRITITDKEGTKTVDVMDGSNGGPGRGITSVKRTSGTGAAGTMDIYTITYSDNTTSTFSVYNGADGKNYTLTEADKTEIAQQAAGLVDVDGVVKSTEQTFTDDEKAQVRTNIGAASASDVSELSDKIADYAVPDYVVAESENVLDRVINAQGTRTFNLAVITDLHNNGGVSDANILHACQGVGYIADRVKLDAFACLGDHTDSSGSADWSECLADILACNNHKHKQVRNTDVLELIGNHDFVAKHSPKTYKTISAYSENVVCGSMLGGYFYKDYSDYKLRIICLNTSESAYIGISSEQYRWFIEAIDLSAKEDASDWQTLIMSHVPLDWSGFTVFGYVLQAYINGTSWTDGTYSCDYTGKNQATIIACVHGHIHNLLVDKLYLGDSSTSTEQIDLYRIAIPEITESYGNHYSAPFKQEVRYAKTNGTAEDTAFNVLCIDLDRKKIEAVCYGAGVDRTIDYAAFGDTGEEGGGGTTPLYTNLVPTSIDTDGSVFNGTGYQNDTYISSSSGLPSAKSGYVTTGCMELGYEWYMKGAVYSSDNYHRIAWYDANFKLLAFSAGLNATGVTVSDMGGGVMKFVVSQNWETIKNYKYVRCTYSGTGENLIVSATPIG